MRHAEHEPSTAEPRAKGLDSARIGSRNPTTTLDKASAPAMRRKTVLKSTFRPARPRYPKSHRGFWDKQGM
jgi:hypothetical protein